MKTKAVIIIALLLVCMMAFNGCDASLELVKVEITSYPDKIVYVRDVDTSISTEGLVITCISRDGHKADFFGLDRFTTNVDFSKEGIYQVTYDLGHGLIASFPVQVISKDWLEKQNGSK